MADYIIHHLVKKGEQNGKNSGLVEWNEKISGEGNACGMLDRRTGKRTLQKIKDDLDNNPDWLNSIIRERLKAENI